MSDQVKYELSVRLNVIVRHLRKIDAMIQGGYQEPEILAQLKSVGQAVVGARDVLLWVTIEQMLGRAAETEGGNRGWWVREVLAMLRKHGVPCCAGRGGRGICRNSADGLAARSD
jgi:DNA-binding FrmR family transcriptional regulator